MLLPIYQRQFERDVALAKKRGKDIKKLKHVISILLAERCHAGVLGP